MKKNIVIMVVALISGMAITLLVFFKINNKLKIEENMITVFQVGVFKNKINALAEAKKYNGIVHEENNYFRVYIAAYQNDEIITKMKNYYDELGTPYYLRKIKIDKDFLTTINKYERLLENSNDISIYNNLNNLLITKMEEHL